MKLYEIDRRVHVMQHPKRDHPCRFDGKKFRVDRSTGYSEEVRNAPQPAEVRV
jgi:hypothetical protein